MIEGLEEPPGKGGHAALLFIRPESPGPRAQLPALTPTAVSHYVSSKHFKPAGLAVSEQGSRPHPRRLSH